MSRAKAEIVADMADTLGIAPLRLSTGSTESKAIFRTINRELGLGLSTRLNKIGLASAIVREAGLEWSVGQAGRGSTITADELETVAEAVRIIVGRRPDSEASRTADVSAGRPSRNILARFEAAQDRLVLQAADLSLESLAAMVDTDAIDIRPEFQRRERWPASKRSALIESFLLNVPVPPVYLAEDDYGHYSVIDGKQRLTAISDFMRNRLPLSQLTKFAELENFMFLDLPSAMKNYLTVRPSVRVVTLLRQSDPELKYEVFHRLNSGGEPLNAQEIRNVVFRGNLNDLIYELARSEFLRGQLKIVNDRSPAYRTMLDAEFVLRFLDLREQWMDFSGDFRTSMDRFMLTHQNSTSAELDFYGGRFSRAIGFAERLWGSHSAFKRPERDAWRDQALAGMYDAQMIAVDMLPDRALQSLAFNPQEVQRVTIDLFGDQVFEDAVRTATNTPSRVSYRVKRMFEALRSAA